MVNFNNIHEELKKCDQWVFNDDKKPIQADGSNASSNNENTWSCFKSVNIQSFELGYGLSFALNNDYIGIDLDNCYNSEGELKNWAVDIVNNLKNAYIEKSLYGKGLHIFIKKKRALKHKNKDRINFKLGLYSETITNLTKEEQERIKEDSKDIPKDGIEIYYKSQFFVMTGNVIQYPEKIGEHQEYIENLFKQLIDISESYKSTKRQKKHNNEFIKVKSRVTILDILKLYENDDLQNNFANCPFHQENVRSLYIYTLTNSFYCFGCNTGGDIFSYVQSIEKISNFEALKYIAKEFDIKLDLNQEATSQNIKIENGSYFVYSKNGVERISNFIIEPINYIELEKYSIVCNILIDTFEYKERIISIEDFKDKASFKSKIHKLTLGRGSYYGTDTQVEYIKDLCMLDIETIKGLEYSGIHIDNNKYFYIDNDSNILTNEELKNKYIVVNKSDNYTRINSNILGSNVIKYSLSDYTNLVENVVNYNNKTSMMTLLFYMSACFIKSRFLEAKIKFPHFNLSAESGTGKTTIKDYIISPFFSITNSQSVASTRHPLNCSLSSTNCMPLIIDEFKMSKMTKFEKKTWSEINRLVFENIVYSKGRRDLSSSSYTYTAPLLFLGENSFNDLADKNRCIDIYTERYSTLEKFKRLKDIQNYLIKNEEILNSFGKLILQESLNMTPKDLKTLFTYYRGKLNRLQPRNMDNVSVLLSGLKLLEYTFFNEFKFDIYTILGEQKNIIADIENMQFDVNQGGKAFSLSVVPKTLETFDTMLDTNKLTKNYHIAIKKKNLVLDIKRIFPEYTKYLKDYNIDTETLDYDNFITQLKQSAYFVSYENCSFKVKDTLNKSVPLKQRKGYVLNVDMLKKDDICNNMLSLLED